MDTRENIYAALYALLAAIVNSDGSLTFKSGDRDLPAIDQVDSLNMPGVYLLQDKESQAVVVRTIPTIWTFSPEIYVYASTGTQRHLKPAQVLNPLVDAVQAALQPVKQGQPFEQTLGGKVSKCRIAGGILQYATGTTGDYCMAVIPVEITVPN